MKSKDSQRLDWLALMVQENGEMHLHDGEHPRGIGLSLHNRTLRQAIDQAMAEDSDDAEIAKAQQGSE
jgi:hypothetical protein